MENLKNRAEELLEYRDGVLYWKQDRGYSIKAGDKAGCRYASGYIYLKIDYKAYRAHRIIWLMHKGILPKQIDHINGIKEDNRIENLRECDNSTNQRNKRATGSSKYMGVHLEKVTGRWLTTTTVCKKKIMIGKFANEKSAAIAYNMWIMRHWDFPQARFMLWNTVIITSKRKGKKK